MKNKFSNENFIDVLKEILNSEKESDNIISEVNSFRKNMILNDKIYSELEDKIGGSVVIQKLINRSIKLSFFNHNASFDNDEYNFKFDNLSVDLNSSAELRLNRVEILILITSRNNLTYRKISRLNKPNTYLCWVDIDSLEYSFIDVYKMFSDESIINLRKGVISLQKNLKNNIQDLINQMNLEQVLESKISLGYLNMIEFRLKPENLEEFNLSDDEMKEKLRD